MKFKSVHGDKYGLPYQGSKTKVIEKIARYFPNADHFYDLFGGGFSVSHYMMVHRSKSYKTINYNELRPGMRELIKDAISGKYNYDVFKPEWISRERFQKDKDINAYIKIIWSFGNNGEDYLFGKEIENEKRSMHMAVIFDEFDQYMQDTFSLSRWPKGLDTKGKRLYLKKIIRNIDRVDLQQLQQLQRLQQLEQKINLTNLDYREVEIKANSVIYCDIPYKGTADYGNSFKHDDFFNWADAQSNPVFISEYFIDDSRFHLLKEVSHRSTFSATDNNAVKERLYGNYKAFEIINNYRNSKNG